MFIVMRNNKTIALVSDLFSAMAVFNANKYPCTYLKVIEAATDKVVVRWGY